MRAHIFKSIFILASLVSTQLISACGQDPEQRDIASISSPSVAVTGSGTDLSGTTQYLFATSQGTIDSAYNTVTATINDPNLPLSIASGSVFTASMYSGSCSLITTATPAVSGAYGNLITAAVSGTSCTDQAVVNVGLDTSQVYDTYGDSGVSYVNIQMTVDVAPVVSQAATGNTAVDGSGTTETTAGYFSLANDQAIVVTFSKSMTSGTLAGTLTGCAATLGTPITATGSNGKTVVWPLSNFSGITAGGTCVLNVAGVKDVAGNADDPSDTNLNMTLTFH